MTLSPENAQTLRQWIVQLREGQFSPAQESQLKQLLADSADARRLYASYTAMLALLELEVPALEPEDLPALSAGSALPMTDDRNATFASPAPVFGFLGSAIHGTVGFFSQSAPFSYVVATVIVGLGLLVGSFVPLSHPVYVVKQPQPSTPAGDWRMAFVARITGMVDCQWADSTTAAIGPVAVPLGRKYALASGLLEITYDTGAKVILQGPCTYEVDSTAGGYLSVGKLAARVEKRGESEEIDRGGSHSTPYSVLRTSDSALFAIRTPTATVTDLGTEFGVEVDEAGFTETHVFQGRVRLTGRGTANSMAEQVLLAGQAARLGSDATAVTVVENKQQRFVRKMPTPETPASRELLSQIDYSDTWTANSHTRPGSYLLLTAPEALQVEHCYGNPPRSWTFSVLSAMTTWPADDTSSPWPGCRVRGSESGFTETGDAGISYFGFEYGLRDDFLVQFDAVQTTDRINITIGDQPATIQGDKSLSVFFRIPGVESFTPGLPSPLPEIGVYTPSKLEARTDLHSGIPTPFEWHNYAVRFNLREKRLTVWVDRQCRGTIDLANINRGMEEEPARTWADLPWTAQYVTVGGFARDGKGRVWTDNFRIGMPGEMGVPMASQRQTATSSPTEN